MTLEELSRPIRVGSSRFDNIFNLPPKRLRNSFYLLKIDFQYDISHQEGRFIHISGITKLLNSELTSGRSMLLIDKYS